MLLDYLTLLLARLGMDLVYCGAFFLLSWLRPSLFGPGWWWKAHVAVALSTLAVLGEMYGYGPTSALFFGPMLSAAILLSWLGVRQALGLSLPLRQMGVVCLLVLGVNTVLTLGWDAEVARRAFLWAFVVIMAGLVQRDFLRAAKKTGHYALLIPGWLSGFEALVALCVLLALPWWPGPEQPEAYASFHALLISLVSLSVLVRGVIYAFLVSFQMQKITDDMHGRLLERESELRSLIDNINAGVIVLTPDQTIISINASAREFLKWDEIFHDSDLGALANNGWRFLREDGSPMPQSETPADQVLATGQVVTDLVMGVQVSVLSPVRWALCNAFGQTNAAGELQRVVCTLVDITARQNAQAQREQLEQQLAQSQKMEALGTLAGGVAHDFNNILAAILGNTALLKEEIGPTADAQDSLREINMAARRGRELVRQVLAFSRQQPKQLTAVNLTEVLAESCQLLRSAVPSSVELVPIVACEAPIIMADSTQIGQILVNLGSNALNAMGERSGRIEFRVERLAASDHRIPQEVRPLGTAGVVCVAVSDQGCGMEASVRQRIFEPFFTTQMTQQSTGLGLAVVLGIVQSHGGEITVESEVGVGTTFTLFFPAAERADPTPLALPPSPPLVSLPGGAVEPIAMQVDVDLPLPMDTEGGDHAEGAPQAAKGPGIAIAAPPSTSAGAHRKNSVLYLDDDDTLIFLVRRLLERSGYKVTTFNDQHAAIEAVQAAPEAFDLFMTDFNMPGMSGLDVARAVLAINPRLPVAVASGYITDALMAQARAVGVVEVVFKTDAVEDFCAVVTRLVNGPAQAG